MSFIDVVDTWKSLLAGREVLILGRLRWHIGDGTNIKIWGDEWMPGGDFF